MTEKEAYDAADAYKALVLHRTQIAAHLLVCPREKSEMTPCIARDGQLAVCLDSFQKPLCVGCEASVTRLLDEEKARA